MVLQKPNFLRSHPSVTIKPTAPAPRFESSGCFLHGALRERNANCPHNLKVANPARLVPLPPIEGVRLAAGGAKHPPRGFRGIPPDTPLVTFVVKRKSPGCRAWQGHALAERLHWRSRDFRPCKIPRGGGAEHPLMGSAEGQRPSHIVGRRVLVPAKASGAEAPKRNGVHKFHVVPLPPGVL